MTDCGCKAAELQTAGQRNILHIAFGLNATMFVVGIVAGIIGQSSGLIADALDMLADASAYAIALMAIERSDLFKARAATVSGSILLILGAAVMFDAGRRLIFGSAPEGSIMMVVATVSLCVNSAVLYLLAKQRVEKKEAHLRAAYIFTRADVIANLAVILSGAILFVTDFHYVDLAVGMAIGVYVIREAIEILGEAREAQQSATNDPSLID